MAITYTYLYTNTPFSANALNLRFNNFLGEGTGLNAVSLDELSLGAFRHNLVPRLIHTAEASTDILVAKAAITDPQAGYFSARRDRAFSSPTMTVGEIMEVDYKTYPVQLGMNSTENVGAVLVLANIDVDRMTFTDKDGDVYLPNEHFNYASAWIRVYDSSGNDIDLDHTRRTLSPRVTIKSPGYGATVQPFTPLSGDSNTNQDISIRTVITQNDLGDLLDVAKVCLVVDAAHPTRVQDIRYGKGNMTAIPLHTDVS